MIETLVVCIGNDLAADDGVGKEVYEQLVAQNLPESTRLLFLGLGGIDLIEQMEGEKTLIVVDAVQFGVETGTVHCIDWENLPHMAPRPVSGHGIGVREALEVCRRLYPERMPQKCWLMGIEGACFNELGEGLSPAVEAAVPKVVEEIVKLL